MPVKLNLLRFTRSRLESRVGALNSSCVSIILSLGSKAPMKKLWLALPLTSGLSISHPGLKSTVEGCIIYIYTIYSLHI